MQLSHMYIEHRNEIDLGQLIEIVPTSLGSLRSKVTSTTAKVQIASETWAQTTVFIKSQIHLLEDKLQKRDIQTEIFCYRTP